MGRLWHYQHMAHSAPNPAHVYGVSRSETARLARQHKVDLSWDQLREDFLAGTTPPEAERAVRAEPMPAWVDEFDSWLTDSVEHNRDAAVLLPTLRAADRILSPAVLAAAAAQTQIQIHKLTPRREQLAALLRARLRAIAATIAAQLLPAPRSAATSAA